LWPFGVALWGEASNHLELGWLKTVVVSVEEKAHVMRQRWIGSGARAPTELNPPLFKCLNSGAAPQVPVAVHARERQDLSTE
jgi:hypothetical protein